MTTQTTTARRYAPSMIALHWLTAVLIVTAIALIELREFFPKGSDPREAMKAIHGMLGLSVLALTAVRIIMHFANPAPAITPSPAAWQSGLARLMHLAIYALMIALPLLGWLMLSAAGKPIPFFGLSLPALVAENKDLAGTFKELHQELGEILYIVIGLHAAAALVHHYLVKDDTLVRMMPAR